MNGTTGSASRSDATTAAGVCSRLSSLCAIVPSSFAAPRSSRSGLLPPLSGGFASASPAASSWSVVSGGVGEGGTYIFEECSFDAGGDACERPGISVSINRACGETYARLENPAAHRSHVCARGYASSEAVPCGFAGRVAREQYSADTSVEDSCDTTRRIFKVGTWPTWR
eukprot:6201746-Pleurochrysis_carterae.AAC.1